MNILYPLISLATLATATGTSLRHKGPPVKKIWPAHIIESCVEPNTVALTFDDGLSSRARQILAFLKQHDLKAAFFILGKTIDPAWPEYAENVAILEELVGDGHIVGNHSWDHPDLRTLAPDQVKAQLVETMGAVRDIIGVNPILFRAPMGYVDKKVDAVCQEYGLSVVHWNVDTEDWRGGETDVVGNVEKSLVKMAPVPSRQRIKALSEKTFQTGMIMLQHVDNFDAEVQQSILNTLKENKLRVVPLDQCLGKKPYRYALYPKKP